MKKETRCNFISSALPNDVGHEGDEIPKMLMPPGS